MALVTVSAVVHVSADGRMPEVIRIVVTVTAGALKDCVITRTGVAVRAGPIHASVRVAHREPGVVERCIGPVRRVVAGGAGRRETGCSVIGVICLLIIQLVAAVAIGRERRVVIVHVAICAGHVHMRPRQREGCVVVIEGRGSPACRAMANVALLREADRDMVWIGGLLKIGEVATDARRIGDVVVSVDVTLRALDRGVGASKRPACSGVVKRRGGPVRRRMTNLALLRKPCRGVIWIVRALIILEVARYASCVGDVVIPVDMALHALHLCVRASQGKGRLGMIKRCRLPDRGGVTNLALLRKSRGDMVGIGGSLKILQVTGNASVATEIEIAAGVALVTL